MLEGQYTFHSPVCLSWKKFQNTHFNFLIPIVLLLHLNTRALVASGQGKCLCLWAEGILLIIGSEMREERQKVLTWPMESILWASSIDFAEVKFFPVLNDLLSGHITDTWNVHIASFQPAFLPFLYWFDIYNTGHWIQSCYSVILEVYSLACSGLTIWRLWR